MEREEAKNLAQPGQYGDKERGKSPRDRVWGGRNGCVFHFRAPLNGLLPFY